MNHDVILPPYSTVFGSRVEPRKQSEIGEGHTELSSEGRGDLSIESAEKMVDQALFEAIATAQEVTRDTGDEHTCRRNSGSIPASTPTEASHRCPLPPSPILLRPLPFTSDLEAESALIVPLEFERQSREIEREMAVIDALKTTQMDEQKKAVKEAQGRWINLIVGKRGKKDESEKGNVNLKEEEGKKTQGFDKLPAPYELYAAIDRKDINFIMRVRDHAFSLLLQKNAGEFPIVYVARIGKTHRDIAILLCGALSRYVNQLDEADFEKKATLVILRQLRTNLKLAIDHALEPSGDTSLLSSYFQVLIMSEGDVWLKKAIHEVSLVMKRWNVPTPPPMVETNPSSRPESGPRRPSTHGRRSESSDGPVGVANKMVRDFCTKELKTLEGGGHRHAGDVGVEEYIANATMDLVILAGWSLVVERTPVEMLPTYTFARDQRTFNLFEEAYTTNEQIIKNKVGKEVRHQLDILREVCADTKITIRQRVKVLKERFDGGGVTT